MLILSRAKSQKVDILGGEIVVTVLEIRGRLVRLGFEAPDSVTIHRREVTRDLEKEAPPPAVE